MSHGAEYFVELFSRRYAGKRFESWSQATPEGGKPYKALFLRADSGVGATRTKRTLLHASGQTIVPGRS